MNDPALINRLLMKLTRRSSVEQLSSDDHDFVENALWELRNVLDEAYRAGYEAGYTDSEALNNFYGSASGDA